MTPMIRVSNEGKPDGTCESFWGRNKCPNHAEFIIKNTTNIGFAIMCEPHKDGFLASWPADGGIEVLPYSDDLATAYQKAIDDRKEQHP